MLRNFLNLHSNLSPFRQSCNRVQSSSGLLRTLLSDCGVTYEFTNMWSNAVPKDVNLIKKSRLIPIFDNFRRMNVCEDLSVNFKYPKLL